MLRTERPRQAAADCSQGSFAQVLLRRIIDTDVFNVLFICTGNSARSITAEAMLNELGKGRFRAYSAGSHPKGAVHPLALKTLEKLAIAGDGFRSKSWTEFAQPDAPRLHFFLTMCDQAAGETCPPVARAADHGALGRRRSRCRRGQ